MWPWPLGLTTIYAPPVIHDVDESLRALVRREALVGSDVEVVFDAPTKDWSTRRNAPTIDMYLYDLREDMRHRQVGRAEIRVDGRVVERAEPPRWFKLSYLVTAWTQRPEDEHRLLAMLLGCFLKSDRLPPDLLVGSLAGIAHSIPYTVALPPPEDRALSDVWSALGGELKPSLDLVVIAPFDLTRGIEIGPPVLEGARLSVSSPEATENRIGPMRDDPALSGDHNGDHSTPGRDRSSRPRASTTQVATGRGKRKAGP